MIIVYLIYYFNFYNIKILLYNKTDYNNNLHLISYLLKMPELLNSFNE